ncbi:MAG: glycogen/starch/alpha-glucan phosphorylase [Caldilineaceae bacterium]|nr:glycogen/starch/alpha-glucan phosphorylase [Caldilineaceae bacterium]MCB9136759.1 glycogen/starch/alpha-glucan phosphorylase [Caldilineaceae bacterium]
MKELPKSNRSGRSTAEFRTAFFDHLYYSVGSTPQSASLYDAYNTLALTVRDHLMARWRRTVETQYAANPKFIYYFSAEYLLGRQLQQNMLYTETDELAAEAMAEMNVPVEELIEQDVEPGLGNGGLGRLAACFLDSMATLDLPSVGYGIRYEYGIFRQSFRNGWQVESPDTWLDLGYPWEFAQPDDRVEVGFGGATESFTDETGRFQVRWRPAERVLGEPYHTMAPGYKTDTVNMLRLWRARATREFDFQKFDYGDYAQAVEDKVRTENITKVLYPNDNTPQGRLLRLKQQYFFVACSLKDIIRRFFFRNQDWADFPKKVAIQLNDTHPVIAIPELMRLLMDEYDLTWEEAWDITIHTFAYTCHTLMPEALEKWPVALFERLLPRHLEIIYEINSRFLAQVRTNFPDDEARVVRMSIIEEGAERRVRMAYLASVGSFSINGVAELQTNLLSESTLRDFYQMWPEKFNNKTNGVTPRRFMRLANPRLSRLISARIGDGWLRDLDELAKLEAYVDDADFQAEWRAVKQANKAQLAGIIEQRLGLVVAPTSLYDVMVKRLHEYKRQLLKALHVIALYQRIQAGKRADMVPRTVIFGAKAAPGYAMAKLIIKLINNIGAVVNNDPTCWDLLKVAYLPNFNVTLGEHIYPAADLSEQISLAGKEASGTGNMKFALNGALTIGTLDGANIEIRERVGPENFFLFGLTADEVFEQKARGYDPTQFYYTNPVLKQAIDAIAAGDFSGGDGKLFRPIIDSLLGDDPFMVCADFGSYLEAQGKVEQAYRDEERWTRMSILNAARCGYFSSDRAIRQYAEEIWGVKPLPVK